MIVGRFCKFLLIVMPLIILAACVNDSSNIGFSQPNYSSEPPKTDAVIQRKHGDKYVECLMYSWMETNLARDKLEMPRLPRIHFINLCQDSARTYYDTVYANVSDGEIEVKSKFKHATAKAVLINAQHVVFENLERAFAK